MIGSHSQVAIPPSEFEFFRRLHISPGAALTAAEVRELVDTVLTWPKVQAWSVDRAAVLGHALAERSYRGIFVGFLRSYAERMHKPRFGEKTTSYERHLGTLDRWFGSDYTFVHVLRHPVATFASTRWYQHQERLVDPWLWARRWNESVLTALRETRAREQRYVAVRYEDLVREPARTIEEVCDASGLPFEASMLAMADFEQKENSSFDLGRAEYAGKIRSADEVVRAAHMPPSDLRVVRSQCRALAAAIGYDLDDENVLLPFVQPSAPLELRFRASFALGSAGERMRGVRRRLAPPQ